MRAEDAYRYTDRPLFVKALSFIAGPTEGPIDLDDDDLPRGRGLSMRRLSPGRHQ